MRCRGGWRSGALVLPLSIMFMAGLVFAQVFHDVTADWGPPTVGAPVDHYVVQVSINGSSFITAARDLEAPPFSFQATCDDTLVVRVAAVDAQGRQGPFSEVSLPHIVECDPAEEEPEDPGPPGPPGQPVPQD